MAKQTATVCCQCQTFVGGGFWNSLKNEWWIRQFNFSTQALSQRSWKVGSKMCYRAFSNELFIMQHMKNNTIFFNNWSSRGCMDACLAKSLSPPLTNPMFLLAGSNKAFKGLSERWQNLIKDFRIGNGMMLSSVICLCILVIIIINNHRYCEEHVNKSCQQSKHILCEQHC